MLLLSLVLAAQPSLDRTPELLTPFACLDLPSCAGAMLVEFNTSGWIRHGDPADFSFLYETGWLLGQDAEHVVLWDAELRIRRLARKPSFPDDWSRLSASHPAGRPLPSEWHEVDFAALCRAAHEDMPADEWGLKDEALKAAVLALWAHQRREWKLRDDLLVTVRARYEAASPVPVLEQLRAGVAANARWRALTDANEGTPRAALLAAWRGIAQLAPQARDGEAGHMVAAYENMLIEDAAHRKPGDAALAEMPAAAQVDVWLHRLRDLAACQRGQPGGCEVFMGGEPSATWAPDALRALGWAAVPGLIARLDDTRPTRSLGYWRNFAPGSYYLLTHADCSRQILYAITGEWFETCADAEAWWREHGEDGAERFLLGQLERGVNMRFAVEQLLARDARAHLSRVAAVLERADATQRIELGGEFARHAGAEHLPLLQSLLACDDPMVCVCVAEALGRLGAPSHSVERVVALIDEAAASSQHDLPFACFWIERAVRFLGKHDRARGARVVLALLGGSSKARGWGLAFARHVPAPDVIAALVAHLEDQAPTGRRLWSGYEVRVCDAAAEALAALLGVADRFKLQGDASQRDKGITALRAHCAAAGEDRAR